MSDSEGIEMRRPSRRTIASGAAWAVPVIAVGAAASAMAASPGLIFEQNPGESCKFPGQSVPNFPFAYDVAFDVTSSLPGTLCIDSVTAPGSIDVTVIDVLPSPPGPSTCTSISAGAPNLIHIIIGSQNSANGTATFTYTFTPLQRSSQSFAGVISNFHPCPK